MSVGITSIASMVHILMSYVYAAHNTTMTKQKRKRSKTFMTMTDGISKTMCSISIVPLIWFFVKGTKSILISSFRIEIHQFGGFKWVDSSGSLKKMECWSLVFGVGCCTCKTLPLYPNNECHCIILLVFHILIIIYCAAFKRQKKNHHILNWPR